MKKRQGKQRDEQSGRQPNNKDLAEIGHGLFSPGLCGACSYQ
jgi:hypothetical protein